MAVSEAELRSLNTEVQRLSGDLAEMTKRADAMRRQWEVKAEQLKQKTEEFRRDAASKAEKLAQTLRSHPS